MLVLKAVGEWPGRRPRSAAKSTPKGPKIPIWDAKQRVFSSRQNAGARLHSDKRLSPFKDPRRKCAEAPARGFNTLEGVLNPEMLEGSIRPCPIFATPSNEREDTPASLTRGAVRPEHSDPLPK